jgi:hypothetical protein
MVRSSIAAAALTLTLAISMAGCGLPTELEPEPTATPRPSASTSAPPRTVQFEPDGSAEDNREYFDAVNQATIAAGTVDGRSFVDALVAAGFDKSKMELTPDKTAIGLDADNIQFTVLVGDKCLVGQYGNIGYHSTVLPVLATGKCLIGKTRTIDW